jgi:hypothetical protein
VFRITLSTNNAIERYLRLTNKGIYCYSDAVKAFKMKQKPLFIIPIINIKSVDKIKAKNKVSKGNGTFKQTEDKYYFKIILDEAIKEN